MTFVALGVGVGYCKYREKPSRPAISALIIPTKPADFGLLPFWGKLCHRSEIIY